MMGFASLYPSYVTFSSSAGD